MDITGIDNQYPSLSDIRVNNLGVCVVKSLDSDLMVMKTLEQIFGIKYK